MGQGSECLQVITARDYYKQGLRVLPLGTDDAQIVRDVSGRKVVQRGSEQIPIGQLFPADWTTTYGKHKVEVVTSRPLGGLICGVLDNKDPQEQEIIAIDCDDHTSWQIFHALDPSYPWATPSKGKAGGTIIYLLPDSLREVMQYSRSLPRMEFMAQRASGANAMVFAPTSANTTKKTINPTAPLTPPPPQVIALIQALAPPVIPPTTPPADNDAVTVMPYNAPLLKKFVEEVKQVAHSPARFGKLDTPTQVMQQVFRIFTPYRYRSLPHYGTHHWLHPNDPDIDPWSHYAVGVSAIAGADVSVSPELYTAFMQAVNAQIDDPMDPERLLREIINPMVNGQSQVKGEVIWRYHSDWHKGTLTLTNEYGELLEYYILEDQATHFIEFNHTLREAIEISSIRALREQIYIKSADKGAEMPGPSIVKKLKMVRMVDSVRRPLGLQQDSNGHYTLNMTEPSKSLQILRNPALHAPADPCSLPVQALEIFLSHLTNDDPVAVQFMRQVLAYHGRHLEAIPVIIYIIGVGGAGKSHFAYIAEKLFGSNTTSRPSALQLTGRFNDFLHNTAVLILSETGDAGSKAQEGIKAILKSLTGEKTIDIETKGKPLKRNVRVFALPILISNDPWYKEDAADRRLFSISPRTSILHSAAVSRFETEHGVRIIDTILQGIDSGEIPRYLADFCPNRLPEVPITADKIQLTQWQDDPIMRVKGLVSDRRWQALFDLMQEQGILLFANHMKNKQLNDSDFLYKGELVELAAALSDDHSYNVPTGVIKKEFSDRWMPNIASRCYPVRGVPLTKQLGMIRWAAPGICEAYQEWMLQHL